MASKITLLTTIQITDESADADAVPATHRIEKELASLQNLDSKRRQIADAATLVLWDANDFAIPATFAFLALWADGQLEVELTTGEGEVTEELSSFRLAANVPFMLGADDGYRNHSASDAYAGTLDVIDKIRIKNISGATVTYNLVISE